MIKKGQIKILNYGKRDLVIITQVFRLEKNECNSRPILARRIDWSLYMGFEYEVSSIPKERRREAKEFKMELTAKAI